MSLILNIKLVINVLYKIMEWKLFIIFLMSNINGVVSEVRVKMMKVNMSKMYKKVGIIIIKKLSKFSFIIVIIVDEIFINDIFWCVFFILEVVVSFLFINFGLFNFLYMFDLDFFFCCLL